MGSKNEFPEVFRDITEVDEDLIQQPMEGIADADFGVRPELYELDEWAM